MTGKKMKKILKTKANRFKVVAKMWDEEVQQFFLGKCLFNKNSKHFKRFKKLSVPISTIPPEIKEGLIKKYLELKAHQNAAAFFKFYELTHPEFDSKEQYEKRTKLAEEIEKDLFENIKSDGLDEPARKSKRENTSGPGSPRVNKKGNSLGFGVQKARANYAGKKIKSTALDIKTHNKLSAFKELVLRVHPKINSTRNIPQYVFKPDKLTLRKLILRGLNEQ